MRDLYADLGSPQKIFIDLACSSHNAMWERNHKLLFQASLEWLQNGTVNGMKTGITGQGTFGLLTIKSKRTMPSSEILIFRASLEPKLYRDFEIADTATLYDLAHVIVKCFDFDFDHAFGFYSKLTGNILRSPVRYELFVDMGEGDSQARSVKRTRVVDAYKSVGTKMLFLFDYGDGWEFRVSSLRAVNQKNRRSNFQGF